MVMCAIDALAAVGGGGGKAPEAEAGQAAAAQRIGPTGAVLPPSERPLVSYLGSPYAVAPDFVLEHAADVEAPRRVAELDALIGTLEQPIGTFGPCTFDGFDTEFKYLETQEAARAPLDTAYAARDVNMQKNRYANILPPEHTRVKLSGDDDYINANYVNVGCKDNQYIASQVLQ